jgi:hypothetical protein
MAEARCSLIESVFKKLSVLRDGSLADAVEWLLFQILHEKSFPLDVPTLQRELATSRHVKLLRTKVESGFYDKNTPSSAVMNQLDAARNWLLEMLT